LIAGSAEHSLPLAYQSYLEAIPTYSGPSSVLARIGATVFLAFWRPPLRCLIRLIKLKVDDNGHHPRWLGGVILILYGLMWGHHDYIHSKICGKGDGARLDFGKLKQR